MTTATLTSKGQLTLPKAIRLFLKLEVGHKLEFVISEHNEVVLKPRRIGLDTIYGMAHSKKKASLDDIDAAITAYHKDRLKK